MLADFSIGKGVPLSRSRNIPDYLLPPSCPADDNAIFSTDADVYPETPGVKDKKIRRWTRRFLGGKPKNGAGEVF